MNFFNSPSLTALPKMTAVAMPGRWRTFFLVVLCSLPAMASPYMPLGLALRPVWMAVALLSPVVILVGWGRPQAGVLARHTWQWLLPWTLFLATYLIAVLWHQKAYGLVSIQLSRLIMGAVIYAAARLIGLRWTHLRWGVWLACGAYGFLAAWEWWSAFSPSDAATFKEAFRQHLVGFRVGLGANPIALGNQLIWLVGLVVLSQLLPAPEAKKGFVPAVLAASGAFFACLLTSSRGPLLALPLLVMLAIAFAPKQMRFRIAVFSAVIFLIAAVGMRIFAPESRLVLAVSALLTTHAGPIRFDIAINERLQMWTLALDGLRHWPLLGPGTAGPGELLVTMNGSIEPMPGFAMHKHFHSDWLQPMVIGGALVALGQFATMGLLLRRSWGNPVLIWIVLAPMAFGLTDRVLHENNSFSFFVAVLALYCAAFDNETGDPTASKS